MEVLFAVLAIVVVLWFVGRSSRGTLRAHGWSGGKVPKLTGQFESLAETLYAEAAQIAYVQGWEQHAKGEELRVVAFMRARQRVLTSVAFVSVFALAVPLGAALEVLPNQQAWLPALPRAVWLRISAGAVVLLAVWAAIFTPRNFARFCTRNASKVGEPPDAPAAVLEFVRTNLEPQLAAVRAQTADVASRQFAEAYNRAHHQAMEEQRRRDAERVADEKAATARAEAAVNAAYARGRDDATEEAHARVALLTDEAFEKGVRAGASRMHDRLKLEREAGFMDGYAAGKAEGSAANAASGRTRFGRARPRSRGDALAILDLPTGASTAEIERRFKELRSTVHPDAVRAKRLPKVVVEFAEEHFKLVGEAHDILRQTWAN